MSLPARWLYPPKGAAVDAEAMVSIVTSRKSTVITVARTFMWLINESTPVPVTGGSERSQARTPAHPQPDAEAGREQRQGDLDQANGSPRP